MSDRPELTVEVLVEHWRGQVQKLKEAGIPLERISESIRTAALEVEQDWFKSIVEAASERLTAIRPPATVHREEGAPDDVSLTPEANHPVMPDAARVATEEKTET